MIADGFGIDRADLKGRHAAGASFLDGYCRYLDAPARHAYTPRREEAQMLARRLSALGVNAPTVWLRHLHLLTEVGNLFVPDPILSDLAWQRRALGNRSFSLTGVTHTICSKKVLDGFANMMIAPVQPWDAVICTSQAAHTVISGVFDEWGGYLRDRIGGTAPRPQLPVIPLGVDPTRFAPADAAQQRASLRERLGIGSEDVAVLFFGRLVAHAKAHPVPLLLALQRAAERTGRGVFLMMTGQFPNPAIDTAFRDVLAHDCPSVRTAVVDGADAALAGASWFAADIFASLSDNIQETFGLTPVEAMAAGLPVVASDWDGYRDTVAHGETGFLIPTLMPRAGVGADFAASYFADRLTYDHYVGTQSLITAVDIGAAADAFVRLIEDEGLRRRMGAAGRARVARLFDWKVVIRAYQELWGELDARRRSAEESVPHRPGTPGNPVHQDPFAAFRCFPTAQFTPDTRLHLDRIAAADALDDRLRFAINTFAMPAHFTVEDCRAVTAFVGRRGEATIGEIALLQPERALPTERAVAWLVKFGVLAVMPDQPPPEGRDSAGRSGRRRVKGAAVHSRQPGEGAGTVAKRRETMEAKGGGGLYMRS
jgi:glycosyltransferase involved in cell wall biosynthesis